MPNTLKALALAEILHEGQLRKCGDPFIIHPLRVTSYLISLKINDDCTCAAALLHEIFKHCGFDRDGNELVEKYGLDEEVLQLIRLVSKPNSMEIDEYYKNLKLNHKALLIKLSNRANTCTRLSVLTEDERKEYITENTQYIYPLCTYGKAYYPNYSDQIVNMKYHISSICRIVESIKEPEINNEKNKKVW
jgi:(p)ppGpp synthase/HD superfamily hydrolase